MRMSNGWSPKKLYWVVFGIGVAVRMALIGVCWGAPFTSDAQDYCMMAHQLVSGVHFAPYWPPGLPLYLALFVRMGWSEAALRIPMLLFWVLLCWALYRIAEDLGVARYAWAVLLVFGFMPVSIQLSIEPLTQLPVAALLLAALSATLRGIKTQAWGEQLLGGVALGWMTLVRVSAAALLVLLPGFAAVRMRKTKPLVAFALGAALVCGWMVRSHELCGSWIINTANAKNFWLGNNAMTPMYKTWYYGSHDKDALMADPGYAQAVALGGVEQSKRFQQMADAYIVTHPGVFLVRTANRVRCFWGFDTFTSLSLSKARPGLFPLSLATEAIMYCLLMGFSVYWIAGAGGWFWKRWEVVAIAGAVVVYAAPYWLSMSHPTYHYPVLAPMALLGALAWKEGRELGVAHWRAVAGMVTLALIQVEWVYRMSNAAK